MPRLPKLLPQPCPICSRTYGSIQYVFFRGRRYSDRRIIVRIKHYLKEQYQFTSQAIERATKRGQKSMKKPYGGIWHTFQIRHVLKVIRVDDEFMKANGLRVREYKVGESDGHWVDVGDYLGISGWNKSMTIKSTAEDFDYIKQYGWGIIQAPYLRRKRHDPYEARRILDVGKKPKA